MSNWASDSERTILAAVAEAGPGGCEVHQLRELLEFTFDEFFDALQVLMTGRKVSMTHSGSEDIITLRVPRHCGLVLDAIRAAGTSCIDYVSIARKTAVAKSEVLEALAHLIQSGVIKEAPSVPNRALRPYILAELVPSVDATGGTTYNAARDIEFDAHLRNRIVALARARSLITIDQMKAALDGDPTESERAKRLSAKDLDVVARALEVEGILQRVSLDVVHDAGGVGVWMYSLVPRRPAGSP